MGYSHKTFICPFYVADGKTSLTCTCAVLRFHDRQSAREYADAYCAALHGWENCTVAQAEVEYFKRRDANGET